MTRKRRKKTAVEVKSDESARKEADSSIRQDLPDEASVVEEKEFTSPKGNKYRIIVTNETDPYDQPEYTSKRCDDEKTD